MKNIHYRIGIVFLSLSLLTTVACTKAKKSSDGKTDSNNSSVSSNIADISSDEPETNESEEVYSTETKFSATGTVQGKVDNLNDIPANCANLNNPLMGGYDKAAEKKRKEILNTGNTEKYYKLTRKKYYISAVGDDENDGSSPEKAFKSVNALDNVALKAGDAVLFERGSVFRLTRAINCVSGVTYGSYGVGTKPKLYFSPKALEDPSLWTPTKKKNVWVAEFPYSQVATIVFNHGSEIGYAKRKGLQQLERNGAFYHNTEYGFLYLYCDKGNPGKVYKSIEASVSGTIFYVAPEFKNITIDNICMKYSGDFAFSSGTNTDGISITNCEMGYIGGANGYMGTVRYGNAVQLWQGAMNLNVSNNWIYQTFDSALSWQGKATEDKPAVYKNTVFNENLLEYNNADFEFWDSDYASLDGLQINNNIMRFTSLGWGTRSDDWGIRGIEGCIRIDFQNMSRVKNVSIKNNIFDSAGRTIAMFIANNYSQFNDTIVSGNSVYLKKSYRTEDTVVIGFNKSDADSERLQATNQSELEKAFEQFAKDTVVKWVD